MLRNLKSPESELLKEWSGFIGWYVLRLPILKVVSCQSELKILLTETAGSRGKSLQWLRLAVTVKSQKIILNPGPKGRN